MGIQLIQPSHKKRLTKFAIEINKSELHGIVNELESLIELFRADIPEKKKISYGRYSIIKEMGLQLYPLLVEQNVEVYNFAAKIFEYKDHDQFVRSLAVQLISIYGLEKNNLKVVLPIFEQAAIDENWEIRECSAGFIRKLIKEHFFEMRKWYFEKVESENPFLRRFASELIRPVADNKWFRENPDFCFSVLGKLYAEAKPYPRTSVGNNLSDWARIDKEKVYQIVEMLLNSKNKNSYWIAYRACRNLVKTEPIRVMDILKVDEYKYKRRIHYRKDYQKV